MIIKNEVYNKLEKGIVKTFTDNKEECIQHFKEVKDSKKFIDLSTRLAWDMLWATKDLKNIDSELLKEYNDSHINTAVKKIFKNNISYE